MDTPALSRELLQAMLNADRNFASSIMERALAGGMHPDLYMSEVLDPALLSIGELWGKQEVSLAQAFVGAKIAEDALQRCLPLQTNADVRTSVGTVVIGNIEDDFHSLGRRMVISFLLAAGWTVHDLGNDVPAVVFLEKALETNASIIAVSAMMQTTALSILQVRSLLDKEGLSSRIKLAVGGAVFNWRPDLVHEVGADGTANNAAQVHSLFLKLQKESLGLAI